MPTTFDPTTESAGLAASRRQIWAASGVIVLAGLAAYHNSLSGAFVFDDPASILDNLSIRHLWPLGPVLSPPHGGVTVEGRPLLNLSLAINYAISGTAVWSYHALNLLIHVLAGLTLFGIVRRTGWSALSPTRLATPFADKRVGDNAPHATFLAFAVALLWTVHPLQTEAVTYLVQRAESLMGLFYLLTLYCFIRGVERVVPNALGDVAGQTSALGTTRSTSVGGEPFWIGLSFLACLFGMATKEVMVSAPLTVLLYDRTFVSGSFREAWRRRGGLYLALAATWVMLGALVFSTHNRGGTSGFSVGLPWWVYWVTQFPAIVHYLWLSVWPHPLVFDYGFARYWIHHALEATPAALAVLALAAATGVGLKRGSRFGFLGYCFFAILAPTSVVPGTRQTMAEHRMYLALIPVLVLLVWAGGRLLRGNRPGLTAVIVLLVLATGLGALTVWRNADYRSELALWSATVADAPDNPFARNSLGSMMFQAGRPDEARAQYVEALRVYPDYPEAQANLGCVLAEQGHDSDGLAHLYEAVRLEPESPKIHSILGNTLSHLGRSAQALEQFIEAIRLDPGYADAHYQWGNEAMQLGRFQEAKEQYEETIRLHPDMPEAHNNLGNALAQLGLFPEAVAEAKIALRLRPDFPEAVNNLGITLAQMGRTPEAVEAFAQAVRGNPNAPEIHNNYANVLRKVGRTAEAKAQYGEALRLKPDYTEARDNLDRLLAEP